MKTLPLSGIQSKLRMKWSKIKLHHLALMLSALFILQSCNGQPKTTSDVSTAIANPEKFSAYWYAGEAEVSSYTLQQMRYGERRNGELVLIYVTEDFLPERQVKDESGQKGAIKILKLNSVKKFETGIYDYSVMGSTFTPIDYRKFPYTLKTSFSSQDWCGQVFSQLNLQDRNLSYQSRSYFEKEGDIDTTLAATYFEEDVWTRMRIEPQMLPLGEVDMIPAQEFLRLMHVPFRSYKAKAVLLLQVGDQKAPEERYVYRIEFPELGRTMEWICESEFPFKILSWEERIENRDGKIEITSAKLTKSLKNSYWERNRNADSGLRDSLQLKYRWQK